MTEMAKTLLATDKFDSSRKRLLSFIQRNEGLMDEFFALVGDYNGNLSSAKNALRSAEINGPVKVGAFSKSTRAKYVKYNPEKLSSDILSVPGVIKELSSKKINELVSVGHIDKDDVDRAKEITLGVSRITGPKEIIVKL